MHFTRRNLFLARLRDHLYWILRRANAGFLTGVIAWFFIPALSRVLAAQSSPVLQFFATGLLGGAFLGTVDGMIEESTPKTIRGALFGAAGGALGGTLFGWIGLDLSAEQTVWGIFLFWAIAGAFIGTVSAWWERSPRKLLAGIVSGLIGGGVGGALGYALYAFVTQEYSPNGWFIKRLMEGLTGGVIGVTLWFSIGAAERFVIFQRRLLEGIDHKPCHHCQKKNPLNAWYCGYCGSVLQFSAPPARLNLSPYTTLDRLREMCRFLSRLSMTTGVIAGFVIFIVFIPVNPFLAVVALVFVAAAGYSLLVVFSSIAESLLIFTKRS